MSVCVDTQPAAAEQQRAAAAIYNAPSRSQSQVTIEQRLLYLAGEAIIASAMEDSSTASYDPADPAERNYFEALWRAANPQGEVELAGAIAVPFFQKSQVDRGFLKQIWTMSCGATLNMRKEQFFTALRFVTMAQSGELPLTKGARETHSPLNI